jgi:endonuclease-3
MKLPASEAKGAYQLVLRLTRAQTITVGKKLGDQFFPAGYYVYTGSAMGSGGMAPRVRRHLDKTKTTRHWHIDYLTTHPELEVVDVIRRPAATREECQINQATAAMPGASVPVPGFGNADKHKNRDCACTAHLVHFKSLPRTRPAKSQSWRAARTADGPEWGSSLARRRSAQIQSGRTPASE